MEVNERQNLLYENLKSKRPALLYSQQKRSQASLVLPLYVASFAQQELNNITLVVCTCNMQGSLNVFVEAADIGTIFNKYLKCFT